MVFCAVLAGVFVVRVLDAEVQAEPPRYIANEIAR